MRRMITNKTKCLWREWVSKTSWAMGTGQKCVGLREQKCVGSKTSWAKMRWFQTTSKVSQGFINKSVKFRCTHKKGFVLSCAKSKKQPEPLPLLCCNLDHNQSTPLVRTLNASIIAVRLWSSHDRMARTTLLCTYFRSPGSTASSIDSGCSLGFTLTTRC